MFVLILVVSSLTNLYLGDDHNYRTRVPLPSELRLISQTYSLREQSDHLVKDKLKILIMIHHAIELPLFLVGYMFSIS